MSLPEILQIARLSAAAVAVGVGVLLLIGAAIGVLRFPDFYTRLHAATVADPLGAGLVALGLALAEPRTDIAVRLVLLALLIGAVGPLWSYVFGNAAHAGGLAPIAGPYRAPRPGSKEAQ
jgi:multicomponent Na+:H+ antiporter subunit G